MRQRVIRGEDYIERTPFQRFETSYIAHAKLCPKPAGKGFFRRPGNGGFAQIRAQHLIA